MATPPPATRQPPPKFLYKFINPALKAVLRSPLHSPISRRLVVLSFQGRKSGKWYSTPVGYTEADGTVLITTEAPWWKNLRGGATVRLRLRGQERTGTAQVITDLPAMQAAYRVMLASGPQLAEIVGIRLDANGEPNPDDVARARERGYVIVQVRLNPR